MTTAILSNCCSVGFLVVGVPVGFVVTVVGFLVVVVPVGFLVTGVGFLVVVVPGAYLDVVLVL